MPPIPSGFSTLWPGPATKPSSDIEILKRSLDKGHLAPNYVPARLRQLQIRWSGVVAPREGETVIHGYGRTDADFSRELDVVHIASRNQLAPRQARGQNARKPWLQLTV